MDAYERYNKRFDNQRYCEVTQALADDLRVEREALAASDAANRVTDAALELCGHASYSGSVITLAAFCAQSRIRASTITALHTYLLIYQDKGDTRADDFEGTAKALLKSYEALDSLKTAVSYANGVHGWRGRMAYDLLAAADFLTQAAVNLLLHGDLSYIREKLQSGLSRFRGALREGQRHSESPDAFDLQSTHFPRIID